MTTTLESGVLERSIHCSPIVVGFGTTERVDGLSVCPIDPVDVYPSNYEF